MHLKHFFKNIYITDKVPSATDIVSIGKNSSNTIKSSSQLTSFGPALIRRSSVSLTSSHATNLCHLSDKDFRSYVITIQDAFLSRALPQLALQLATKFRLISDNLAVFAYAHHLYLNFLTPSDIRTRFDQLPQINNTSKFNKKRLTNILQTMIITSANGEWNLIKRILSYSSSLFPTKIKLAEYLTKQLRILNQQLVYVIFFSPCENEYDYTSVICEGQPCYYSVKSLVMWNTIVHRRPD